MSYRFKKSWSSGPFRITASKSGLSYSMGVKGATVNVSRRGTYVAFGISSIQYRRKIPGTANHYFDINDNLSPQPEPYNQHTITSGDVQNIADTNSQDFINELVEKRRKIAYYNWFGKFPLTTAVVVFCFSFFVRPKNEVVYIPERKDYITSYSKPHINIRRSPDKNGKVVGLLTPGDEYELLDSSTAEGEETKTKEKYQEIVD